MRFRALGCSICVHALVVAAFLRLPWAATLSVAFAALFVNNRAADLLAMPDWRMTLRRAGYAAAFFTGCLFFFLFLRWEIGRMASMGGFEGVRVLAQQLAIPRGQNDEHGEQGSGATQEFDNAHPGVVIYSGQEEKVLLVPPAHALREGLKSASKSRPFEIPFFGAYWLYRSPQKRPPVNSQVTHGRPSELRFRSTDGTPLKMEARQNLGRLVDLRCCRTIEVQIANADPYPSSILMELVLSNTVDAGAVPQSLGMREVHSSVVAVPWRTEAPILETLSFPITQGSLQSFDELRVIFHLSPVRDVRSARISIDRFVLVP